jgi:hypothetical protein
MFYVVPNYIHEEIERKLDAAITACPDAAKDREALRAQLLDHLNEYGVVPDFSLKKSDGA